MPGEQELTEFTERLARVEVKVEALAENVKSMNFVEERVGKIDVAIVRMEAAIENTNNVVSSMARRIDESTSETSRQLNALFKMHSRTLSEAAEQKLEQERKLFEIKFENEKRITDEKLATIQNESTKRIELLESQKAAADALAESRRFLNRLKDWKVIIGFLSAVIALAASFYVGIKWLILYVQQHP